MEENQTDSSMPKLKPSPKKPLLIIGSLTVIVVSVALLSYFKIISLGEPNNLLQKDQPKTELVQERPTKVGPDNFEEKCTITKEDNPLVDYLTKLEDGAVVGTLGGNLQEVNIDGDSAKIVLVSPRAEQMHQFTLKEEKGLVYDSVTNKDAALKDLKAGQNVTMSFNCFPQKNNLFKITRVDIRGKK